MADSGRGGQPSSSSPAQTELRRPKTLEGTVGVPKGTNRPAKSTSQKPTGQPIRAGHSDSRKRKNNSRDDEEGVSADEAQKAPGVHFHSGVSVNVSEHFFLLSGPPNHDTGYRRPSKGA